MAKQKTTLEQFNNELVNRFGVENLKLYEYKEKYTNAPLVLAYITDPKYTPTGKKSKDMTMEELRAGIAAEKHVGTYNRKTGKAIIFEVR
jgi:hypothetical protein